MELLGQTIMFIAFVVLIWLLVLAYRRRQNKPERNRLLLYALAAFLITGVGVAIQNSDPHYRAEQQAADSSSKAKEASSKEAESESSMSRRQSESESKSKASSESAAKEQERQAAESSSVQAESASKAESSSVESRIAVNVGEAYDTQASNVVTASSGMLTDYHLEKSNGSVLIVYFVADDTVYSAPDESKQSFADQLFLSIKNTSVQTNTTMPAVILQTANGTTIAKTNLFHTKMKIE